jgi:hypothetical protein
MLVHLAFRNLVVLLQLYCLKIVIVSAVLVGRESYASESKRVFALRVFGQSFKEHY